VSGGELFTHLYRREKFTEDEVRFYIGEIILALEHLHKVSMHAIGYCAIRRSNVVVCRQLLRMQLFYVKIC
jgi:serine/threonine protein kinase